MVAYILLGVGTTYQPPPSRARAQLSVLRRRVVHTFRKEPSVASNHVATQKPAVTKLVISLNQLNPVSFSQAQLV